MPCNPHCWYNQWEICLKKKDVNWHTTLVSWLKVIDWKNSTWHPASQIGDRNFSLIQELKGKLFQDLENVAINLFGGKSVNYFYHSMSLIFIFPSLMCYFTHLIQIRANVFWLNVIYILYIIELWLTVWIITTCN